MSPHTTNLQNDQVFKDFDDDDDFDSDDAERDSDDLEREDPAGRHRSARALGRGNLNEKRISAGDYMHQVR